MDRLDDLLPARGGTWTTTSIPEAESKPVCRQLMEWYRSKTEAGPVRKAEAFAANFDPKILPHLSILTLEEGGEFRYRLFGTARREYYGEDVTGKLLREVETGEDTDFVHRLYRAVVAEGRPVLTHTAYKIGGMDISYDRLLIPLSDEDGTVRWLLKILIPVVAQYRRSLVEFAARKKK